jgi:hypothetical protein
MAGRGQGSLMAWCSRAKHGYRYSRVRTAAAELTQSTVPMTANGRERIIHLSNREGLQPVAAHPGKP